MDVYRRLGSFSLVTKLSAPYIDRLKEWDEWRDFFKSLDKFERRATRTYLNYKKQPDDSWSFLPSTEQTLKEVDEKAYALWAKFRAIQLKFF